MCNHISNYTYTNYKNLFVSSFKTVQLIPKRLYTCFKGYFIIGMLCLFLILLSLFGSCLLVCLVVPFHTYKLLDSNPLEKNLILYMRKNTLI